MERHATQRTANPVEFPTIREAARLSGFGEKTIRRWVRDGWLTLYDGGTARPHVHWPELVALVKSTRRPAPSSHVHERLREVLAREERRAS